MGGRVFLTAEWRHLVMLNYEVDRVQLAANVPVGTELDEWNGRTYLSVVGFLFLGTRVLGLPIPFHRDFEEVNLRFYVRRRTSDGWRRGVVFVKEIVPRRAIASTARVLYNENYVALTMGHTLGYAPDAPARLASVSYRWSFEGRSSHVSLETESEPGPLLAGSEEEFITEHFWGYTTQRDGGTVEYEVRHPTWSVAPAVRAELDCDVARLYGERFAVALSGKPLSAFLANGSPVTVFRGRRLA